MVAKKVLAALALSLTVFSGFSGGWIPAAQACGPFFDDADFSYPNNPDLPLKKFVGGRLGIVEPTFAKTYLVVAYRYLNDKPLSVAQQNCVQALLLNRLDHFGHRTNLTSSPKPEPQNAQTPVKLWVKAHNAVSGIKAVEEMGQDRQISEASGDIGESYLNCSDDAFLNATKTLQDKIAKHGATSPFVKNWVNAQDKVFCHCGGNQYDWKTKKFAKEPGFPELTAQDSDAEAKYDRHYQIAAAHFYAQQFDAAFKEFSAIADDASSPYSAVARYMSARCLIRKTNLAQLEPGAKQKQLEPASKILHDILTNNSTQYQSFHLPAQKMISFINCITEPDKEINSLGRYLAVTTDDKSFQQSLDDYTSLLHKAEGFSEDYYDPQSDKLTVPKTATEDDLTHWLVNLQMGADQDKVFKTAETQFEKTHSLPWLLCALTYAPFDKSKTANLVAAARALPVTSPGYLSINYAAAKLLIGQHDTAGANSLISALESFARKEQIPSSVNLLMDLRAKLPINTSEFVANGVRIPAGYSTNMDYFDAETEPVNEKPKKIPAAFAIANAEAINKSIPVSILANLCGDDRLPDPLKLDLSQATFVRAILLDDKDALKKSIDVLNKLSAQNANLKSVKQLMPAVSSSSGVDQKFAAAYMMLHNPGFGPFVTPGAQRQDAICTLNEFNDNWWDTPPTSDNGIIATDAFSKLPAFPGLLTAAQKTLGQGENKKIAMLGAGPACLGEIVCSYASTHPADARIPEALAKVVWATHYGAKDKQTSKYSKQAFELLHRKYPKSPFTAKTPYHY